MRNMRKFVVCILAILMFASTLSVLSVSAADLDIVLDKMQEGTYTYKDDRGVVEMPYRYYFPTDYDKNGDKTYSVLIFLHGAGERGTNNLAPLTANVTLFKTLIDRNDCIIIAPQCAADYRWVEKDWGLGSYVMDEVTSPMLSAAMALLKETMENEAVDPSRVYAVGLSMGAFGVWDMLVREPELFAAAVPSEGAGDPSKAELLVNIPIWAFHGDEDISVPVSGSREMVAAIESAGGKNIKYSEYAGRGHGVWNTVWEMPEFYEWLFSQINESKLPDESVEPEVSPEISEAVSEAQKDDGGKIGTIILIAIIAVAVVAAACVVIVKKKKKA